MASDLGVRGAPSLFSSAPMSSWTGFYVGLNGGGGWGTTSHSLTIAANGATAASGDFDVGGGLFGGTIGYNHMCPRADSFAEVVTGAATGRRSGASVSTVPDRSSHYLVLSSSEEGTGQRYQRRASPKQRLFGGSVTGPRSRRA